MKSEIIILFISAIIFLNVSPVLAQNGTYDNFSQQTEVVSFQSSEATEYNPSASRLALQFGSGTLFGAAGVFVGGFTGYAANGFEDDLSSLAPLFLGSTVGYLMGTSSGIYIVANSNSYDASFGYILLGNIVGAGAGITGTLLIRNALSKSKGYHFFMFYNYWGNDR